MQERGETQPSQQDTGQPSASIRKTAWGLLPFGLPSLALKGYFTDCKAKAGRAINKIQKYVERRELRDKRVGITSYFQSLGMTRHN